MKLAFEKNSVMPTKAGIHDNTCRRHSNLLAVVLMLLVTLPAFASVPSSGLTAHSPARHGPLHHKRAKRPMTTAQKANASRMKECGRQWKAAKAAGRTNGQKWPQYWSACSKRMKG